jgi:hypothetical protein
LGGDDNDDDDDDAVAAAGAVLVLAGLAPAVCRSFSGEAAARPEG